MCSTPDSDTTTDGDPTRRPTAWLLLTGQLWPDTIARLDDLLRDYGVINSIQRRRLRTAADITAVRIEVQGMAVPRLLTQDLRNFAPRAELRLRLDTDPIRTAVFISRERQCLDALLTSATGSTPAIPAIEVSTVISNHDHPAALLIDAGIHYHYIPTQPGDHPSSEARALSHLRYVELVVLADYRRTLSAHSLDQLTRLGIPVITTRQSVITTGGRDGDPPPKPAARNQIEASAHYLGTGHTLGPAIAEEVDPVPADAGQRRRHAQQIPALARALVQAVQLHHQHRVALVAGETVVFD